MVTYPRLGVGRCAVELPYTCIDTCLRLARNTIGHHPKWGVRIRLYMLYMIYGNSTAHHTTPQPWVRYHSFCQNKNGNVPKAGFLKTKNANVLGVTKLPWVRRHFSQKSGNVPKVALWPRGRYHFLKNANVPQVGFSDIGYVTAFCFAKSTNVPKLVFPAEF